MECYVEKREYWDIWNLFSSQMTIFLTDLRYHLHANEYSITIFKNPISFQQTWTNFLSRSWMTKMEKFVTKIQDYYGMRFLTDIRFDFEMNK
jgi:hypothetical protein